MLDIYQCPAVLQLKLIIHQVCLGFYIRIDIIHDFNKVRIDVYIIYLLVNMYVIIFQVLYVQYKIILYVLIPSRASTRIYYSDNMSF